MQIKFLVETWSFNSLSSKWKMSNSQQKRVMFALYQEPFIVPQEAGADQLSGTQDIHALWPSSLPEVTSLEFSDSLFSFSLCFPLFVFLSASFSVCVSPSLLHINMLLLLPPFFSCISFSAPPSCLWLTDMFFILTLSVEFSYSFFC